MALWECTLAGRLYFFYALLQISVGMLALCMRPRCLLYGGNMVSTIGLLTAKAIMRLLLRSSRLVDTLKEVML